MNRKNQSILHVTSALLVLLLTLFGTQAYAQTPTNLKIINPPLNGIVSSGFEVTGTYHSVLQNPVILIELAGVNYTAVDYNGVFNYTTSIPDGTYNMVIYLLDSSTNYRASVQFNQISQHMDLAHNSTLIVPDYSESCSRMIQLKDYSECPPLSELMKKDTSNQEISGHFVMQKDGTYIREKPEVQNHYQFYTNMTDKKVCVGCPVDLSLSDKIQQIIIVPTGFSFTNHEFTTVTTNNTYTNGVNDSFYITNTNEIAASIVVYHDWYADPSCNTVTIDYSEERYQDAIDYLKSNCMSHAYNSTTTTLIPDHPFIMNSPFSSLAEDTYNQQIFNGHKQISSYNQTNTGGLGPGNCINTKCTYTDPYKKQGY